MKHLGDITKIDWKERNPGVNISPEAIPDEAYSAANRILFVAVRSFFSYGENRASYEAWMRTPEGMAAAEDEKRRQS